MKTPIIYEWKLELRASDLDPYHHVSSHWYLEYVISSRWHYLAKHFGEDADSLADKGLGFFISKASLQFRRPIRNKSVVIRSHLSKVLRGGRLLEVPYEMVSQDEKYSFGTLRFSVVDVRDIKNPRLAQLPDWAYPYFFE